jgi:hypothetical protein
MSHEEFVTGKSRGVENEQLYQRGSLHAIEWIIVEEGDSAGEVVIRLRPLAKRPKAEGEQFPPTFNADELLRISDVQMPAPRSLQDKRVFVDGILPAVIGLKMADICRYAREVSINVPAERRWVKVSERRPEVSNILIGDRLSVTVFGHAVTAEVVSVSDAQVYVQETGKRRGQRVWLRQEDIRGWT